MIDLSDFAASQKNKSIKSLIELRDELMSDLIEFEDYGNEEKDQEIMKALEAFHPSPETVYKTKHKYLSIVCGLIADKL